MLGNCADPRYAQTMLGHEDPNTTHLYSHVAMRTLLAIHQATHPGCQGDSEAEAPKTKPPSFIFAVGSQNKAERLG